MTTAELFSDVESWVNSLGGRLATNGDLIDPAIQGSLSSKELHSWRVREIRNGVSARFQTTLDVIKQTEGDIQKYTSRIQRRQERIKTLTSAEKSDLSLFGENVGVSTAYSQLRGIAASGNQDLIEEIEQCKKRKQNLETLQKILRAVEQALPREGTLPSARGFFSKVVDGLGGWKTLALSTAVAATLYLTGVSLPGTSASGYYPVWG